MSLLMVGTRETFSRSTSAVKSAITNSKEAYIKPANLLLKRTLLVLGALTGIIMLSSVTFSMHAATLAEKMDESGFDYVNEMVPAISTDWDEKKLLDHASSEFTSVTDSQELTEFFTYCEEKLGKMELYLGSQGEAQVFINNFTQEITGTYAAIGEFEKGKAVIYVNLIRKNDKWQILGYQVNSDVLRPY